MLLHTVAKLNGQQTEHRDFPCCCLLALRFRGLALNLEVPFNPRSWSPLMDLSSMNLSNALLNPSVSLAISRFIGSVFCNQTALKEVLHFDHLECNTVIKHTLYEEMCFSQSNPMHVYAEVSPTKFNGA